MTSPPSAPDPIELLPIPDGAVLLAESDASLNDRELVIAALRQRLEEGRFAFPIGPSLDLANPERLLSLNGFAVQLLIAGFSADEVDLPLHHWHRPGAAPQLVFAARLDEENQVVQFVGVMTAPELQRALQKDWAGFMTPSAERLELPLSGFRGGVERLLTLVQLLHPEAISREGFSVARRSSVVSVLDWLSGQLDDALQGLGGSLVPATAGSFRSALETSVDALAVLSIPLGLEDGQLCSGAAAVDCIERFRLLLIPSGVEHPERLLLRLVPELDGDLLPAGLTLVAQQGDWSQTMTSRVDTQLEMSFSASDQLLQVGLRFSGSRDLDLPPLQLPQ